MLLNRVTGAFWTLPALGAVLAAALALLAVWLDRALGGTFGLLFAGGPESARAMLAAVASSVLTFAALTFSITVVALQLASSQFSPRVLSSLLQDRWTQTSLAVFVGSFVFSLLVLREVRGGENSFVPGLAVGLALLLGLASIGTLVGFIHHMAQSLRVVTIIDRIHDQTRGAIEAWYADDDRGGGAGRLVPGEGVAVATPGDGVLSWFDRDAIVERAEDQDVTVEVLVAPGSWVCEGQPVLLVRGGENDPDATARLRSFIGLSNERDVKRDPAYGFRQIIDIAERALSPGVNDPTTAVQCLDRVHALLRRLARRDLAVGDTIVDGTVRLRIPVPTWADFLALGCDEARHWGASSLRVHRRLEAMLRDLLDLVDGDRADDVLRQLELLRRRREDVPDGELEAVAAAGDPAERLLGMSAGSR